MRPSSRSRTRSQGHLIQNFRLANSSFVGRIDNVASGSYFGSMRSVGIKVLKNKLSEYIRLAAAGETVLVTDRDPWWLSLVRLRPIVLVSDALLLDAVRQGWSGRRCRLPGQCRNESR